MRLRKQGWAGLAVAAVGLALAVGALLSGQAEHPAAARPAAPAAALEIAPARLAAPGTPAPAGAATPRLVIKRILPIKGPIRYGEWHWDEAGVPAGPLVVTVDLDARVLSVFRDGYEIAATAVLLGTSEKPTPTGLFPITEKDADHTSNIYDGAPMPYMMRLTNDGVTIHGTRVENGYASHGCIGMPAPFAEKVFGATALGDKVYITRGKTVGMGDSLTGT